MAVCLLAQSLQLCLSLCDPVDWGPPGSSVHGLLQARILECLTFPSPGNLPGPGIKHESLRSPAFAGRFFTTSATWEVQNNQELSALLSGFFFLGSVISSGNEEELLPYYCIISQSFFSRHA